MCRYHEYTRYVPWQLFDITQAVIYPIQSYESVVVNSFVSFQPEYDLDQLNAYLIAIPSEFKKQKA